MALHYTTSFTCLYPPLMENRLKSSPSFAGKIQCQSDTQDSSPKMECTGLVSKSLKLSPRVCCFSSIHEKVNNDPSRGISQHLYSKTKTNETRNCTEKQKSAP
ncbi:hypothetical protein Pint_26043 [Pistacia integerrima]|uniref:Uncharacterized protein n=1 Tax=Pistacia integerrima TaxID=434235 RepID=A0ACC0YCV2_9ROSI|nr:hypothetical protein Pint_26043 [Pistacia integerrima]